MPVFYILLPVHSRRLLTERFVKCLRAQTHQDFHLILIDDGSTDGTADMVRSIVPQTTVLLGKGNWWWGGSLHQGINHLRETAVADSSIILFINDDLTVEPDYLERAARVMADKKGSFVLSRVRCAQETEPQETGTHVDLKRLHFSVPDGPEQINCLSTQGLFAHWSDVRVVGGFHPRLLPHYLSDYEYTIRAHRMGFKCETSAELVIDLNRDTTGFHRIEEKRFVVFLKKFFSLKSPANPVYFSSFVWLVCPSASILPNLARVWRDALRTTLRAFLISVRS